MEHSSPKRRLSLKTRLREPSRSFSPFDVALQATRSVSNPITEPSSTVVTAASSPPGAPPSSALTEDSVFTSHSIQRQQQSSCAGGRVETPKSAPLPLPFTQTAHKHGHIHFSNDVGIDEIDAASKTSVEQETATAKMEKVPKSSCEISKYKKRRFSLRSPVSTLEKQPKVYRHLSLEPPTISHNLNPLDDVFFDIVPLTIKDDRPEDQASLAVAKVSQSPTGAVVFCGNQSQQRSVRWSLFDEDPADKDIGVLRRQSIDAKQQRLEFYLPLRNVEEEATEESRPSSSNVLVLKRIPFGSAHKPAVAEPVLSDLQAEIKEEIEISAVTTGWLKWPLDYKSKTRHRRSPKLSVIETRRAGQQPTISAQYRPPYHYSPFKAQKSYINQDEPLTLSNVWNKVLNRALYTTGRRKFGQGVVGKFFGRVIKKRSDLEPHVKRQLDDFDDYRPYFTYWIMTVHILVLLIALITYGFGPFGFSRTQYASMVLQTSLVLEQVAYFEQENFWLGPRFADLVHLGAKYSPCMRRDRNIEERIEKIRLMEKESACCIRNDRTGCVQTSKNNCPTMLATWYKWDPAAGSTYENRTSGTVCSQDPRECRRPSSIEPFKWPDDITMWPICTEISQSRNLPHTRCELTGRPCCIGILGECRITTREYCDFVKGYFHDEATLILHCVFTLIVQYLLMRDLEKLIGWFRLSVIYLGSGIFGNLASAVFVPYEPEVGPAGSQFGLLAGLLVDAIYSRHMIVEPWKAISQLLGVLFFLFILGLLPWVDNWAHAFGFLSGLLLSLALFPYIQFKENDFRKRLVIIVVCLCSIIGLFVTLLVLFYFKPLWKCNSCTYFNCIPFTEHLCDNEDAGFDVISFLKGKKN
uniref:Peptidase S54 rhomboid domain-containing protein n=1 Tax=Romanomermis culicivorax TaxID=13658 RepID=A0A915HWJ6_ROMCU